METTKVQHPSSATIAFGGNQYVASHPDRRSATRDKVIELISVNGYPAIAYDGWIYLVLK